LHLANTIVANSVTPTPTFRHLNTLTAFVGVAEGSWTTKLANVAPGWVSVERSMHNNVTAAAMETSIRH